MVKNKQPSKFFIVGCARSGTTLVHKLVASHSQVVGVFETYLLKKFNPKRSINEIISHTARNEKEYRMVLEHFKTLDKKNLGAFEFLDEYCEAHRHHFKKSAYVEKSPLHTLFIGELLTQIPKSKIIAVLRDPRAIIGSRLHGHKASRPYSYRVPRKLSFILDLSQILFSYKQLNKWYLSLNKRLNKRILFIKYEDLIKKPEQITRKILTFLELPWEPVHNNINPIDIRLEHYALKEIMNSSYGKKKSFTIQGDSLEKWKEVITFAEAKFIKQCISQAKLKVIEDFYPYVGQSKSKSPKVFLMKIFSVLDYYFFLKKNIGSKLKKNLKIKLI